MKETTRFDSVSLKDIAEAVGVDPSTVSRAINHPERVRPATRDKINACIEKLNYYPNLVARGLQSAESNLIAVVVPNFTNMAFAKFEKGINDSLKGSKYELIICSSMEDSEKEITLSKGLVRQRVGGVVFYGTVSRPEEGTPFHIFRNNSVVLSIDLMADDDYTNVFLLDAYNGIKAGLNHLKSLGHERIALITGNQNSIQARDRVALIKSLFAELEIDLPESYIKQADWSASGAWHAMDELLCMDQRPTAVFAITDTMALGAMGAINAEGLRIPEDISILGFNNEPGSESLSPPLTTIGPRAYDLGMQAGRLILNQLDNKTARIIEKTFLLELIIRRSTAPPQ